MLNLKLKMKEHFVFFALMSLSVETTTVLPTTSNGALQSHLLQLEQTVSNLQSQSQVQEQKYAAVLSNVLSKLTTTTDELTGVKAELSSVKTNFDTLEKDHQSLQKEFVQLKKNFTSHLRVTLHLKTDLNASESKLLSISSVVGDLSLALNESKKDLGSLNIDVINIKSDLNKAVSNISTFAGETDKLKGAVQTSDARLKVIDDRASILSRNVSTIQIETESVKTTIMSLSDAEANLSSTLDNLKTDITLLQAADTDGACALDGDLISTQHSNSATTCPVGFIEFGHSCYLFSRMDATFVEANSFCRYFSSHLAAITKKDEDDFIRNYLLNHGEKKHYYIGGSDLRQEGFWTWACSDRNLTYTNWSSGQPDNNAGTDNCLIMYSSYSYRWNDDGCDNKNRFICERKL